MKRILVLLLFFLLVGCSDEDIYIPPSNTLDQELVIVEIKGAVKYPGVYEVSSNAIIKDIIDLAGGVTNLANLDSINLASKIESNQLINIPYKNSVSNLININTASLAELTTLEGIGNSKALAIIKYRNEMGLFTSIEDLKKVKGIGEGLFEKIKANITI